MVDAAFAQTVARVWLWSLSVDKKKTPSCMHVNSDRKMSFLKQ